MDGTTGLSWMAWTWPTAAFFAFIFLALVAMSIWERYSPGGNPRHGILGLDTTRGDRLFISLLGSAFILLAWLGIIGTPLWGGLVLSLVFALAVFRWVWPKCRDEGFEANVKKSSQSPYCDDLGLSSKLVIWVERHRFATFPASLSMRFENIFTDDPGSKSFAAGSVIFEKGAKGEEMYVIKEGEVDIFIEDCHLETISRDDIFGELCLIDQESRIASAVARTDCVLQAIDKRRFLFLVQETPLFAIRVMKVLADRLRRVDVLLAKWEHEKASQSSGT
jgi:predicted small integral membrane protein